MTVCVCVSLIHTTCITNVHVLRVVAKVCKHQTCVGVNDAVP